MKIIVSLSILTTSILSAEAFTNPLPNSVKSIDNGGVKSAIDAYKDGIGAELIDKPGVATDNSAMNILVLKYGEAAKSNNVTIVDQVVYGNGTAADKIIAGKLTLNGAACNDGNIATIGETWLNGVCQGGTMVNGTTCNDGNAQTINDIYTNNICAGTNVQGQSCNDNISNTYADKYNNGICSGINAASCNEILGLESGSLSGTYTIDPDGSGGNSSFSVYCDMTSNGGGWTEIIGPETTVIIPSLSTIGYAGVIINSMSSIGLADNITCDATLRGLSILSINNIPQTNIWLDNTVWTGGGDTVSGSDYCKGAGEGILFPTGSSIIRSSVNGDINYNGTIATSISNLSFKCACSNPNLQKGSITSGRIYVK